MSQPLRFLHSHRSKDTSQINKWYIISCEAETLPKEKRQVKWWQGMKELS